MQAASAALPSDPIKARLPQMSLEQQVGQLLETYVYGSSATTPSAADAAQNRAAYGVDTAAQVIAKYHLGSVIYFTWSDNLNALPQIAGLSNGLQQAALDSDSTHS